MSKNSKKHSAIRELNSKRNKLLLAFRQLTTRLSSQTDSQFLVWCEGSARRQKPRLAVYLGTKLTCHLFVRCALSEKSNRLFVGAGAQAARVEVSLLFFFFQSRNVICETFWTCVYRWCKVLSSNVSLIVSFFCVVTLHTHARTRDPCTQENVFPAPQKNSQHGVVVT